MKKLNNLMIKGFVSAEIGLTSFVNNHPEEMYVVKNVIALSVLMLVADQAVAGGLGAWFTKFKSDTIKPAIEFGMYAAYAGGLGGVGLGVHKGVKLSGGDQQTKLGESLGYLFGGGALMGLGAVAQNVGESMNIGGCAVGQYCGS